MNDVQNAVGASCEPLLVLRLEFGIDVMEVNVSAEFRGVFERVEIRTVVVRALRQRHTRRHPWKLEDASSYSPAGVVGGGAFGTSWSMSKGGCMLPAIFFTGRPGVVEVFCVCRLGYHFAFAGGHVVYGNRTIGTNAQKQHPE